MVAYAQGISDIYNYELPTFTLGADHVANSNATILSVLNAVGVDVRTLPNVVDNLYFLGFPGATGEVGSGNSPTLLGSDGSLSGQSERIVASAELDSGVALLGRDEVDDYLIGTEFADKFFGEQDAEESATIDTVSYEASAEAVTVDLTLGGGGSGGAAEGDAYIGIENVTGSGFDDSLVGDDGDNTLLGGPGEDELYSGDGADVLDGGAGDDFLVATGEGQTTFVFGRGYGHDAIWNICDVPNPRFNPPYYDWLYEPTYFHSNDVIFFN